VNAINTAWRTDDPCPVCGTGLISTDNAAGSQVTQDCPLCGWSATWLSTFDTTKDPLAIGHSHPDDAHPRGDKGSAELGAISNAGGGPR
jgi:hypothetical protein